MASWIGASPSQRFWQYILPAARDALARGDAELCRADLLRKAAQVEADFAADTSSVRDRKRARRLEALRREWRSVAAQEARDRATVAEGDRRKAARKSKAA